MVLSKSMTTWNKNLSDKIYQQYQISPKVIKNYKIRYGKHRHRLTFLLSKETSDKNWFYNTFDYIYASRILRLIKKETQTGEVRTRNHWVEFYIYFNGDVEDFLDKFTPDILNKITEIQVMPEYVYKESEAFQHDYPVQLEIRNSLPFNQYRYKIFITASCTIRKEIGRQNINHLYNTITQYENIRTSPSFCRTQDSEMVWDEVYFYTKSLDLLPVIYLMEHRFIRNIIEFRTLEEIDESTT